MAKIKEPIAIATKFSELFFFMTPRICLDNYKNNSKKKNTSHNSIFT